MTQRKRIHLSLSAHAVALLDLIRRETGRSTSREVERMILDKAAAMGLDRSGITVTFTDEAGRRMRCETREADGAILAPVPGGHVRIDVPSHRQRPTLEGTEDGELSAP